MTEKRSPIKGDGGPVDPDAWKRAVHKRAPKHFQVQPLPPEKFGNSYSYGFRIFPIKDDDISIFSYNSSSGRTACSVEYDIWRKWEDCLVYQDALETAYSRAAREKRNRLAAGKGIKKNGIYVHSDQASSWESLPFGPNPNAIANDLHQYIPKLSKKATFFRPSPEMIHQRHEELVAMIGALLDDDLPMIIKEIKATPTFTDFFGVWRRDVELERKLASQKKSPADQCRHSLSMNKLSVFSISPSSQSPNKGKAPERVMASFGTFSSSDSSSEDFADPLRPSRLMDRGRDIPLGRSRASSSDSHSSASLPSTPVGMSPLASRQPLMASQEVPLRFGHNPHTGVERHPYLLQSLPEDQELNPSPRSSMDEVSPRKRSGSTVSSMNRNAHVYVPSPSSSAEILPPRSLSRFSRSSFQSRHSSADLRATTYLDELDVDYCLPSPTPVPRGHPRASVCSMASVVTNSSVDAVMPRNDRPRRPIVPRPDSLAKEPEYEVYEPSLDYQEDFLDEYFSDMLTIDVPVQDYPETPMTCRFPDRLSVMTPSSFSRFYSDRRSSISSQSTSTSSTGSGNPAVLYIKAIHEEEIVMLRLPHYISFKDLRHKIYQKFGEVERPTISESFAIALLEQSQSMLVPPPASKEMGGRPRSPSCYSTAAGSTYSKGSSALCFISSQEKWEDIVATYRGQKMVLRVIGSRE